MKTLGNILWHVLCLGFVNAIIIYLLGLLLTLTVIASPIGLGLMEYGKFLSAPFSNYMVNKSTLNIEQSSAWKAYSTLIMILYLPFGFIFLLLAIIQIFGLLLTIISIPFAIVIGKSLGTYLNPVNKICVPCFVIDDIERRSYFNKYQ